MNIINKTNDELDISITDTVNIKNIVKQFTILPDEIKIINIPFSSIYLKIIDKNKNDWTSILPSTFGIAIYKDKNDRFEVVDEHGEIPSTTIDNTDKYTRCITIGGIVIFVVIIVLLLIIYMIF